jgi:hypothetical protein
MGLLCRLHRLREELKQEVQQRDKNMATFNAQATRLTEKSELVLLLHLWQSKCLRQTVQENRLFRTRQRVNALRSDLRDKTEQLKQGTSSQYV